MLPEFDPEFASPADYARLYRALGLQVVPSMLESEKKKPEDTIKRPIINWRQFTKELISDEQFNEWYGPTGIYSKRGNLGILTGVCSGRVFVLDLDTHTNPVAQLWWDDIQQTYGGSVSETPTQRTGGGGLQLLFRYPESWVPPTIRTQIGVDIRGVGGFAVIAPSKHSSGRHYEWLEGLSPSDVEIAMAPEAFLRDIDELAEQNGHVKTHDLIETVDPKTGEIILTVKTQTPQYATTAWGEVADGREDKMMRMVWRCFLNLYRENPVFPNEEREREIKSHLFEEYCGAVVARIHDPGQPKHLLLEREGRGITEFNKKWKSAKNDWDGKVAEHAKIIREPLSNNYAKNTGGFGIDPEAPIKIAEPVSDGDTFTLLRASAIKAMPDPIFFVEDIMPEESFGFVIGEPGCLKSFIVLGLALSAAAGLDEWFGYKINKHGPTVYVTTEGLSDVKYRMMAWEKMTGIDTDTIPFYLTPDSMNFMQKPDVYKMVRTAQKAQTLEGKPPVLVVIDTASRVLPGADENLQKDMTLFIAACDYIRQSFKTCVLAVHHMSRNSNGTMRGSTVFDGAADFILWVQRERGQLIGTITATKIKTAQDGWEIDFTAIKIDMSDGFKIRSSLYIERTITTQSEDVGFGGKQETGMFRVGAHTITDEMRDTVLTAIKEDWDANEPWSIARNTKTQRRHVTKRLPKILRLRISDSVVMMIVDYMIEARWIEDKEKNKDTHLCGLSIKNDPRKRTEVDRSNPGSNNFNSVESDNDINDIL